jgi:hypothetical protein
MARPRPPPELADDAVVEILLRLPPDDPAGLVRASVVCKRWRLVVADPSFPRHYRSFHGAPPLLGLLRNVYDDESISVFLPTTSFRPRGGGHSFPDGIVVDCRHGHALLLDYTAGGNRARRWTPTQQPPERYPSSTAIPKLFLLV